jgi:glycosyltransferase involved in cell wall biosynthesis
LNVPPDYVTRFINGVAPQFFRTRGTRPAWRNVLFVGGWLEVKGSNVLPALWSQVYRAVPDARLSLVGTGSSEVDVLQHFSAEVRPSIRVVPRLEASAMEDEYARHDVLLMPSWNEGSPLALLEAMAAGLAVVATRTGGIPDIVSSGTDGLLFEAGNAAGGAQQVLRFFEDAAFARSVAQAGQQRARDLTWQAAARAVADASACALKRQR